MGIPRPAGEFAGRMLDPGGWPQSDEDTFYDRAQEYNDVLRRVTVLLEITQRQRSEIFEGGMWSGSAASAADSALSANIGQMRTLQDDLATVITWHRHIAGLIVQAKSDIGDNVDGAQRQIDVLKKDLRLTEAQRDAAINSLIAESYRTNTALVEETAEQVLASTYFKPPRNALEALLDQRSPPAPSMPTRDVQMPDAPTTSATAVSPVTPFTPIAPVNSAVSANPVTARPTPSLTQSQMPSLQPSPTLSSTASAEPSPQETSGASPDSPVPETDPRTYQPSGLVMPADQTAQVTPAATSTSKPQHSPTAGDDASSAGEAPVPVAGAASGALGSSARTGGAGSAASLGPRAASSVAPGAASRGGAGRAPLAAGKAPTRPASSSPAARTLAARSEATARRHGTDHPELPAPESPTPLQVPVSKARAARDAVAEASSARKSDPLRFARRVAAALNAPGNGDGLGFFWITALTTDGQIVVANSYGLAYIPDEMQLPHKVKLASADNAIPASERARTATYPVIAVQAWAAHHDMKLRAVIGTKAQLSDTDPGAAKIVLEPDDIPESGTMTGRSGLEIVDPEAAARLADTADVRLLELVPPAPVEPLEDQRRLLWLDVMKPMMSKASGRAEAHLRAFRAYAEHVKENALHQAHTASDAAAQRCAVADWLYWQRVVGLLDGAAAERAVLGGPPMPTRSAPSRDVYQLH